MTSEKGKLCFLALACLSLRSVCTVALTHQKHERGGSCAMSELAKLDSVSELSITADFMTHDEE